jgi:GWxTD domain-containing protein
MIALRRAAALGLFLLLGAAVARAASLPELLQKAKAEFGGGSYNDALKTLAEIETESGKPGLERDRAMLEPIIAFYRGASYASLGMKDEARANFTIFLKHQPNASLDAGLYSKKVIAALEDARKSLPADATPADTSVEAAYGAFAPPAAALAAELPGADWADGPVRYVLGPAERQDYQRLSDTASRSAFVVDFWHKRDPTPETPENEMRAEFEKRVAFADSRFTQQETRGSLTDRGMVFVLLGPPTYVGRKPLATGEDAADASGLSRGRASDARVASSSSGSRNEGNRSGSTARAAAADAVSGPGRTMTDAASNWREVWHYRKEKLPGAIPYLQVDFEFVTKRGYGENVLQRDAQVLDTLERAKAGRRTGT